jgi:hypothetical protein
VSGMQRGIPDPGFADDDGSPDAALTEAIEAYAAGRGDQYAVLTALARTRLLVALVALPASSGSSHPRPDSGGSGRYRSGTAPSTRAADGADMVLVMLNGLDGRRALPAFTSLDALSRWNPGARPVPATTQRVCLAALGERADLVVVDPAGPATFLLDGLVLRALAAGREPLPPLRDPAVVAAARAAAEPEPGVAAAYLFPATATDCVLGLVLAADVFQAATDTARDTARVIAGRVARRLADDPVLRDRLDRGLDLAVLPPGTLPEGAIQLFARSPQARPGA